MCKTIRKKIREHTRAKNIALIQTTIEKNQSLNNARRNLNIGKKGITSIKDKEGHEITDQQEIMHRIKEFYEQLYSSETPGESIIEETNEKIPDIMTSKVTNAIKENEKKKGTRTR